MSESALQKQMVGTVAEALGPELRSQVAFVGGCTTAFLLTDDFALEQVRHTEDVDLIVHVMGYAGFHRLQNELRAKGFKDMPPAESVESAPVCAMRLGGLRVDFMPDDPRVLGFSNRWYRDALETASEHELSETLSIRLVSPPYFLATKLEAYRGRGKGDVLSSHSCAGRQLGVSPELGERRLFDLAMWVLSAVQNADDFDVGVPKAVEQAVTLDRQAACTR
jgi:predicted nucleotidyltransferase